MQYAEAITSRTRNEIPITAPNSILSFKKAFPEFPALPCEDCVAEGAEVAVNESEEVIVVHTTVVVTVRLVIIVIESCLA